jgi:hypothetical protein
MVSSYQQAKIWVRQPAPPQQKFHFFDDIYVFKKIRLF